MRSGSPGPARILLVDEQRDVWQRSRAQPGVSARRWCARRRISGAAAVAAGPFDVAIVAAGDDRERALDVIARLARAATYPVIVLVDADDSAFIHEAATRGAFAYLTRDDVASARFESTVGMARHRHAEYRDCQGAVARRDGRGRRDPEAARRIAMLEQAEAIAGIGSYIWNLQTGEALVGQPLPPLRPEPRLTRADHRVRARARLPR